MPEYLEIFDEHNQSLQLTKLRRLVHEEGHWHRTAQVYVVNKNNELLCNLRSPSKDVFPLLWDVSFGGHLEPGESYEACAARELAEELGITVPDGQIQFVSFIKIDGKDEVAQLIDREHAGIFVYRTDILAHLFNYQQEEIVELRYFPLTFIKDTLRSHTPEIPFIPLQQQFLDTIAFIEQHMAGTTH